VLIPVGSFLTNPPTHAPCDAGACDDHRAELAAVCQRWGGASEVELAGNVTSGHLLLPVLGASTLAPRLRRLTVTSCRVRLGRDGADMRRLLLCLPLFPRLEQLAVTLVPAEIGGPQLRRARVPLAWLQTLLEPLFWAQRPRSSSGGGGAGRGRAREGGSRPPLRARMELAFGGAATWTTGDGRAMAAGCSAARAFFRALVDGHGGALVLVVA
jgi:hypothetical protein